MWFVIACEKALYFLSNWYTGCSDWVQISIKESIANKSVFCHGVFSSHSPNWQGLASGLLPVWSLTNYSHHQRGKKELPSFYNSSMCSSWWHICYDRNAWPMDVPAYRVSHQLKDQKCTAVVVQFMVDGEQLVPWLMKPIDLFPNQHGHAMLICMFYFLRAWLTYNPSLIFFYHQLY